MKIRLSVLLAMVLSLGGCASEPRKPNLVEAVVQTLPQPEPGKAQIVFLEPINSIQGLIPVGLYEVNGEERTFLAATGSHGKVALSFTPGHHLLMANTGGMVSHFLDVNVEAGKRYYVLERFIYANGFQLRPIRPSGTSDYAVTNKDFARWVADTRFVEITPEGQAFFEKQKDAVAKSQAAGWKTWLAKTPQERAELTLNPEDAISY